ncbi:MAG: hypothetical protein KJ950_16665 [Proteobacteria bacterium]|nr:hypothetical protein [Pseudomonadota bacterium]MBU1688115.1 hypothetical protein [Pseudomonadota bacterium]
MLESAKPSKKNVLIGLALLGILLAGFWVRFDSLAYWLKNPDQYFFQNHEIPVSLGVDSYYYYDIAADLKKGVIRKVDDRRHYPDGTPKVMAVPLLSALLALFSTIFGTSVEWVALVLPSVLGSLLALPVFFLGYLLIRGARLPWQLSAEQQRAQAIFMGLCSALFAVFSPYFVKRSSVGWCDTDSLNVVFATLSIVMAMGLAAAGSRKEKVLYGGGWCVTALLYAWWWDLGSVPVLVFSGFPLGVAFLFTGLKSKKALRPFLAIGGLMLVVLVIWKGGRILNPTRIWNEGAGMLAYVLGKGGTTSVFPVLEQYVGEQRHLLLNELADNIAGGLIVLMAGLGGLLCLGFLARRNILFLVSLLVVSILSFKGQRFLVFTAPLLGLGLGTIMVLLWNCSRDRRVGMIAGFVFFVLVGWSMVPAAQKFNTREPILSPALFEGYKEASFFTPEDAVIWASWGNGHPLIYYSQRKTLGDGMYHPSHLLYYQNFPMATDSFQLAANWIRFRLVNGEQGLVRANELFAGIPEGWEQGMPILQRLLRVGIEKSRMILAGEFGYDPQKVEETLKFLFPEESPPIYLFLDYKHFLIQSWYGLGAWDFKSRDEPRSMKIPLGGFAINSRGTMVTGSSGQGPVSFNIQTGLGSVGEVGMGLSAIKMDNGVKPMTFDFPERKSGHVLYLTMHQGGGLGVVLSKNMADSVFVKMLLEKNQSQDFIVPVNDRSPAYVLCKVNGEAYTPPE